MTFTEEQLQQMMADEAENPLCSVCAELLAQLKDANAALALAATRATPPPQITVSPSAPPAPAVQVTATPSPAPNVTVNVPPPAPRSVVMTVLERERNGPNEGMIKRVQFDELMAPTAKR
jgi:hypothetical protein